MKTISNRLWHITLIFARILGALALLVIALFCVFGFLAAFEPGNGWLWKAGYAAIGCTCLTATVVLTKPLIRSASSLWTKLNHR
jgi:hypothetical protein